MEQYLNILKEIFENLNILKEIFEKNSIDEGSNIRLIIQFRMKTTTAFSSLTLIQLKTYFFLINYNWILRFSITSVFFIYLSIFLERLKQLASM